MKEVILTTIIEQDRRGRWYPSLQARMSGVIIFSITQLEPCARQPACARRALEWAWQIQRDFDAAARATRA